MLGVNYIDTAPRYGLGRSECLVGHVLSDRDREDFVLSAQWEDCSTPALTVDGSGISPLLVCGVTVGSSLQRLRLGRVDVLFIHSPTDHFEAAMNGAYLALAEMRSSGLVGAIGVGMTDWRQLLRFAREGDFDCFLLAGRYTLLDHSALEEFLPYCLSNGIGVVVGGPYSSGILASDLGPDAQYDYRVAPSVVLEKARRIRGVCAQHNVPLKAAALQFALAHPAVTSVIPGSSYPEHVQENVEMVQHPIPPELWDDLRQEGLIDRGAPV